MLNGNFLENNTKKLKMSINPLNFDKFTVVKRKIQINKKSNPGDKLDSTFKKRENSLLKSENLIRKIKSNLNILTNESTETDILKKSKITQTNIFKSRNKDREISNINSNGIYLNTIGTSKIRTNTFIKTDNVEVPYSKVLNTEKSKLENFIKRVPPKHSVYFSNYTKENSLNELTNLMKSSSIFNSKKNNSHNSINDYKPNTNRQITIYKSLNPTVKGTRVRIVKNLTQSKLFSSSNNTVEVSSINQTNNTIINALNSVSKSPENSNRILILNSEENNMNKFIKQKNVRNNKSKNSILKLSVEKSLVNLNYNKELKDNISSRNKRDNFAITSRSNQSDKTRSFSNKNKTLKSHAEDLVTKILEANVCNQIQVASLNKIPIFSNFVKFKIINLWKSFTSRQIFINNRKKLQNKLTSSNSVIFDQNFKYMINYFRVNFFFKHSENLLPHDEIWKNYNYINDHFDKLQKEITNFIEFNNKIYHKNLKIIYHKDRNKIIFQKNNKNESSNSSNVIIYNTIYLHIISLYIYLNIKFFNLLNNYLLNKKIEFCHDLEQKHSCYEIKMLPDINEIILNLQNVVVKCVNSFNDFSIIRNIGNQLFPNFIAKNVNSYSSIYIINLNSCSTTELNNYKDMLDLFNQKLKSTKELICMYLFNMHQIKEISYERTDIEEIQEMSKIINFKIQQKYQFKNTTFNFSKIKTQFKYYKVKFLDLFKHSISQFLEKKFLEMFELSEGLKYDLDFIISNSEKSPVDSVTNFINSKKKFTSLNEIKIKLENFIFKLNSILISDKENKMKKLNEYIKNCNNLFFKIEVLFTDKINLTDLDKDIENLNIKSSELAIKSKEYLENILNRLKNENSSLLNFGNKKNDFDLIESEYLELVSFFQQIIQVSNFKKFNLSDISNQNYINMDFDSKNDDFLFHNDNSNKRNEFILIVKNFKEISQIIEIFKREVCVFITVHIKISKLENSKLDIETFYSELKDLLEHINLLFKCENITNLFNFSREWINKSLYIIIKKIILEDADSTILDKVNDYFYIKNTSQDNINIYDTLVNKCFKILIQENSFENFKINVKKIEKKINKSKILFQTLKKPLYKDLQYKKGSHTEHLEKFENIFIIIMEFTNIINEYLTYKKIINNLIENKSNTDEINLMVDEDYLINVVKIMITLYIKFQKETILEDLKEFLDVNIKNITILLNIKNDFFKLLITKYPKLFYLCEIDLLNFISFLLSDPNENFSQILNYFYQKLNYHSLNYESGTIKGVNDKETNKIHFQNEISYNSKDIMEILCEIKNEIKFSLKYNLITSLNSFTKTNFFDWIFSQSNQIIICNLNLIFVNEITQILISSMELNAENKESSNNKVKNKLLEKNIKTEFEILLSKYNTWIELISKKVSNVSSEIYLNDKYSVNKINLPNILLTINDHKNILENLIKNKITEIESYEWLKYIRHLWDNTRKEIIVECGGWSTNQQFNYIGNYSKILLSPQTEKIFLFNASCFREKSSSFIKIITNSQGYFEIFKDFANYLWIEVVSIDLGKLDKNDYNFSFFKKILDVSIYCKNWIFLEEGDSNNINNFQPNLLFYISKIMQIIQQEIILNEIKQSDSNLKIKMFCLMGCLKIDSNIKLKEYNLKSSSRILNLIKPDLNFFVRNIFSIFGNNTNSKFSTQYLEMIHNVENSIKNKIPNFYFDFFYLNSLKNKIFEKCLSGNCNLMSYNSINDDKLEANNFIRILCEFSYPLLKSIQLSDMEIYKIFDGYNKINLIEFNEIIGSNLEENKIKYFLKSNNKLYNEVTINLISNLVYFRKNSIIRNIIYGLPGCGKTSLITYFAEYINNIELKSVHQYELVNIQNLVQVNNNINQEIINDSFEKKEILYHFSLTNSSINYITNITSDIYRKNEHFIIEMTNLKELSITEISIFNFMHFNSNIKYRKLLKYFIQSIISNLKNSNILINDEYNLSVIEFINKIFAHVLEEYKVSESFLYYKTIELCNMINLYLKILLSNLSSISNNTSHDIIPSKSLFYNLIIQSIILIFYNNCNPVIESNEKFIKSLFLKIKSLAKSIMNLNICKSEEFDFYLNLETFQFEKYEILGIGKFYLNNNLLITHPNYYIYEYTMKLSYYNKREIAIIGNKYHSKTSFYRYFLHRNLIYEDKIIKLNISKNNLHLEHEIIYIDDLHLNSESYLAFDYYSNNNKDNFIIGECQNHNNDLFYKYNKIHLFFNSNDMELITQVYLSNYLSINENYNSLHRLLLDYSTTFSKYLNFKDLTCIKNSFLILKNLSLKNLNLNLVLKLILSFSFHSKVKEYTKSFDIFLNDNLNEKTLTETLNSYEKIETCLKVIEKIYENSDFKSILVCNRTLLNIIQMYFTGNKKNIIFQKVKFSDTKNNKNTCLDFWKIKNFKREKELENKTFLYSLDSNIDLNFEGVVINLLNNNFVLEEIFLEKYYYFNDNPLKPFLEEIENLIPLNKEIKLNFVIFYDKIYKTQESFKNEYKSLKLINAYIEKNFEIFQSYAINDKINPNIKFTYNQNKNFEKAIVNLEIFLNTITVEEYQEEFDKLLNTESGIYLLNYLQKFFMLDDIRKFDFLAFISNKFSLLLLIKYLKIIQLKNSFKNFDSSIFNETIIGKSVFEKKLSDLYTNLQNNYYDNINYFNSKNYYSINYPTNTNDNKLNSQTNLFCEKETKQNEKIKNMCNVNIDDFYENIHGNSIIISILLTVNEKGLIMKDEFIQKFLSNTCKALDTLGIKYSNTKFIDIFYTKFSNSFMKPCFYKTLKKIKAIITGKDSKKCCENILNLFGDNFSLIWSLNILNKLNDKVYNQEINIIKQNHNYIKNANNKEIIKIINNIYQKNNIFTNDYISNNDISNLIGVNNNRLISDIISLVKKSLQYYKNMQPEEILNSDFFYFDEFLNFYDEKYFFNFKNDYFVNKTLENIYLSLNNKFLFAILMTLEIMQNLNEITQQEFKFIIEFIRENFEIKHDNTIKFNGKHKLKRNKNLCALLEIYKQTISQGDDIIKIVSSFIEILEEVMKKLTGNKNVYFPDYLKVLSKDSQKLIFYLLFMEDQSMSFMKFLINKYLTPIHFIESYKINDIIKRKIRHPISIKSNHSINLTNFLCSLAAFYEIEFFIIREFSLGNNYQENMYYEYNYIIDNNTYNFIYESLVNGYWVLISNILNESVFLKIYDIIQQNEKLIHRNFKLFIDINLIDGLKLKKYLENYSVIIHIDNSNVDDLEAAHDMWVNVLDENMLTETVMEDTQNEFLLERSYKKRDISSITNKNAVNDDFMKDDISEICKLIN